MLDRLKKKPLSAALLLVFLYGLWFVLPAMIKGIDPNMKNIEGIQGILNMWSSEAITATVLVLFLSLMGWWKKIGFHRVEKGGLKFLLPIFLIALLFLNFAWVFDDSNKWFLGFSSPVELLSVIGVVILLGFVEEGIFRGALFYGLSTKFTPLFTVILTAVIFGLFHFVNLLTGKPFTDTLYQVVHAGGMGFLYAALRLRLGAIWPLMLMHGFWDFSLFVLQSAHGENAQAVVSTVSPLGFVIAVPALLYGTFVYWRWTKTHHADITQKMVQIG